MKILINGVQVNWANCGGQAGYIYNLCKKLTEFGHNVYLLSSDNHNCDSIKLLQNCGVSVYIIPTKFDVYGWIKYFFISTLKSIQIIKKYEINIIHTHSIYSGLSGILISFLTNKPLIATFHGGDIPSLKWRLKKLLRKIISKRCSKIILLNKNQMKEFIMDGIKDEKLFLIQTGVDIEEFNFDVDKDYIKGSFGIKNNEKVILAISILNKRKNINLLIKSFSIIIKRQYPFKLIIAGDGPEKHNLERFAGELKIDNNIIFTGLIQNRKDVLKLMKCADIFVLTSLEEGLPLTLLEAMAAKVPVVSTKVGGVPEIITDENNGYLVSYDPIKIADTVIKILSNEKIALRISEEAYKNVAKNHSWDQIVLKNEIIYGLAKSEEKL